MKNLILLTFCFATPLTHAAQCFVVNTCLKNVSKCSLDNKTIYSSYSGTVHRSARVKFEWKEEVECLHSGGRKSSIVRSDMGHIQSNSNVQVEELRIPATLKEVPEDYLKRAAEEALAACEEEKQELINSAKNCK